MFHLGTLCPLLHSEESRNATLVAMKSELVPRGHLFWLLLLCDRLQRGRKRCMFWGLEDRWQPSPVVRRNATIQGGATIHDPFGKIALPTSPISRLSELGCLLHFFTIWTDAIKLCWSEFIVDEGAAATSSRGCAWWKKLKILVKYQGRSVALRSSTASVNIKLMNGTVNPWILSPSTSYFVKANAGHWPREALRKRLEINTG